MDASFVSYCIRRHSGFLSLSVGCQHFLSHSEVSLHYLVFAFLRRGRRYSTTTSSAVPRRVSHSPYRRVLTAKHSALGGFWWRETLVGGARAAPRSESRPRILYQMQTFPSGIYRGNFHSPQSLVDYRSSFFWTPRVRNLWKCFDPITYLGPFAFLSRKTCTPGTQISLVTLSLPKLIGVLVLPSAPWRIMPLF